MWADKYFYMEKLLKFLEVYNIGAFSWWDWGMNRRPKWRWRVNPSRFDWNVEMAVNAVRTWKLGTSWGCTHYRHRQIRWAGLCGEK